MESFDEAYARYLGFLATLDQTDDIREKNRLFRQLTQLLSDLETRIGREAAAARNEPGDDEWERLLEPDLYRPTRLSRNHPYPTSRHAH